MGKFQELRNLLKTCILLALLIQVTHAYSSGNGTYRTNFCLCQMDVYLLKVRQMLSVGQVPPPTPPTTTPGPTTINTASTSTSAPKTTTNTGTTTKNTASTTTNTGSTTAAVSTTTNTATSTANTGSTLAAVTITTNTGSTTAAVSTTTNTATFATNTGSTTAAVSTTTNTAGSSSTVSVAVGKRRKRQAAASTTTAAITSTGTGSTTTVANAATGTGSTTTVANAATGTGLTTTVANAVTGTGSTTTVANAATGTGSTTTTKTTTKASTAKASGTTVSSQKITLGLPRDYIAGIATPSFGVIFDGTVKLVDDYGVFFDADYNPSLCPCATNQTVEVGMCLLNVPYNASYANINSTQSHDIVARLLPWLDNTLIDAFSNNPIYIRVLPRRIQNFNNKSAQLFVEVDLRNVTYKPEYYVNNAINPRLTVVIPPAVIMGYQVDIAQTGCYSVVDVTPVVPVVRSAMYYLRFLAIPIALAILVLMIFCTCCGSRDQFYVRFW